MRRPKHVISWKKLILLFVVLVLTLGMPVIASAPKQVKAATVKNGMVKEGGNTYYYQNGKKLKKRWVRINNAWYYFLPTTGAMAKNKFITTRENDYYVGSNGKRLYGWQDIDGATYFFSRDKGIKQIGFLTDNGKRYYIRKTSGKLLKNAVFRISKKTYWASADGSFLKGWHVSGGKKYYFTIKGAYRDGWYTIGKYQYHMDEYGACEVGWQTIDGNKHYFVKSGTNMGVMMKKGIHKIGSKTYEFGKNGVLIGEVKDETGNNTTLNDPSSDKTIKNFLLNSLKPVGSTLYVWGGGHNEQDATRKGVSPVWKTYYNSQSGSYDYNNSRYQSTKGLDCSGFVGWSIYQVMQKASGGTYYTTLAEEVASANAARGFGTLWNQSKLSSSGYKFVAGDLGCTSGHTWIVLGQCSDKSLVIVHATPPCLQIAGTPTPDGGYSSKAIALAQKYMGKYYSGTVNKFGLKCSTGTYYIKGCNIMRWNTSTLKDPDGYRNKTADEILADLFGN